MNEYKRAGALIFNKKLDKCLMVYQKSSSLWGIPKGSREGNENNFICMLREVKEEVGLDLNQIKFDIIGNTSVYSEALIYILKIHLDPLPICSPPLEYGDDNHEISHIKWVNISDVFQMKKNSITRNALNYSKKYFKKNNKYKKKNYYKKKNIIVNKNKYYR